MASKPLHLFVSYSHADATWSKRLLPVLYVKANVEKLQPWHDTELKAGDRWDPIIQASLKRADVFLCLVSYNFLASKYIAEVELPLAMRRHKRDRIEIVPIILYPLDLRRDCPFLFQFNPLPAFGKSWREFEQNGGDWNDALYPIGNGIKDVVDRVRKNRTC